MFLTIDVTLNIFFRLYIQGRDLRYFQLNLVLAWKRRLKWDSSVCFLDTKLLLTAVLPLATAATITFYKLRFTVPSFPDKADKFRDMFLGHSTTYLFAILSNISNNESPHVGYFQLCFMKLSPYAWMLRFVSSFFVAFTGCHDIPPLLFYRAISLFLSMYCEVLDRSQVVSSILFIPF